MRVRLLCKIAIAAHDIGSSISYLLQVTVSCDKQ